MSKRISMIVANYNNGPFLEAFINSICQSCRMPDECILVDDGSTDGSVEILAKYNHLPFLKLIFLKQNQGFTTALNRALAEATGDYIMRADPDDVLHKDRIQKQYAFMEAHPKVDVLGCNAFYFSDDPTSVINKSNFPQEHAPIKHMFKKGENALLHATAFVRGDVYRKYRYQAIFPGEDYELFARMIRDTYTFHNLPQALYGVRVHAKSSTSVLRYAHIEQTFRFREQIFGLKASAIRMRTYYWHLLFYRRYQQAQQSVWKYPYLLLSIIMYPQKLWKRIFEK